MIFQNTQKPKTPKRLLVVNYFLKSYKISDSTFGVLLGRTGKEA